MIAESSKALINESISWNNRSVDKLQQYEQPMQEDHGGNDHNPFQMGNASEAKSFRSDEIRCNEVKSQPPLQPSPNIVDQISFEKTSSTRR